jgi:hypothetical protein
MKLLIYSHYFAPSLDGVENIVRKLATGLASPPFGGNPPEFEVVVVTQTTRGTFDDSTLPFPVVRKPGIFRLTRLIRNSDVVHLAGPALLPLFLTRLIHKPIVVEHHGYQAICPNGSLLLQPEAEVCPGHFQGWPLSNLLSLPEIRIYGGAQWPDPDSHGTARLAVQGC